MKDLGIDMHQRVLNFLPVKDVLKYRAVSSHWLGLVDGTPFAIDHEKNSKPKSVLCDGNNIFFLDLQDRRASMGGRVPLNQSDIEILGSYRGILAVMADSRQLFLWNPATRFFRKIWCPYVVIPQDLYLRRFAFYAFGCGEKELKLMRLVQFLNGQGDAFSRIEAYGVKTKTWDHYEGSFPYFISMKTPYGVVLDQSAHWLCSRTKSKTPKLIIAVDFNLKSHKEIPLPEVPGPETEKVEVDLTNLGGSLCVTFNYVFLGCKYCNKRESKKIVIWTLKDSNSTAYWSQLLAFEPSHWGRFRFLIPVCFFEGGKSVLLNEDGEKFLEYDLSRRKTKRMSIVGTPSRFSVHDFQESMLSLVHPWRKQKS